jgi:hypothetical protein
MRFFLSLKFKKTIMDSFFQGNRPLILTILCILSFVGCGLGVLGDLWAIATFKAEQVVMSKSDIGGYWWGLMENLGFDVKALFETKKKFGMLENFLNLAGTLFCLLGAIMMWKLKKGGFYLYLTGQIIPLITSFFVYASLNAALSMIIMILSAIIPVIFIIGYKTQLRYMK